MNKRAVVEIGLVQLLGLILAIAIIVGTVWFFGRLSGIFTGSGAERATEVAFQTLAYKINELAAKEDSCAATPEGQNLYVGANYAIVGFNKGKQFTINVCGKNEQVQKPLRPDCSNKSCICLYKTQKYFKGLTPIQCSAINADFIEMPIYTEKDYGEKIKDPIFMNMRAPLGLFYPLFANKIYASDFLIFGKCDQGIFGGSTNFGTQRMYVQKIKTNQKTEILVAAYDKQMEGLNEKCAKEQKITA